LRNAAATENNAVRQRLFRRARCLSGCKCGVCPDTTRAASRCQDYFPRNFYIPLIHAGATVAQGHGGLTIASACPERPIISTPLPSQSVPGRLAGLLNSSGVPWGRAGHQMWA